MPATLFATITTTQKITSSEHHQPIFEVVILTFFQWLVTLLHLLRTPTSHQHAPSVQASETRFQNTPDRKDYRHTQRSAVVAGHHPTAKNNSLPDRPSPVP